MSFPLGSTSVIDWIFIQDKSVTTDVAGLTGVTSASPGLAGRYNYPGGTAVALTFETITTLGTYQAPTSNAHLRIKEVDATNMPGWYEVHYHNDWYSVANNRLLAALTIRGVTNMVQVNYKIPIERSLKPTTPGQTLAIESDGMAHADVKEIEGTDATNALDARIQAFFGANLAALMASFGARVLQTGGAFDVTPDRVMRTLMYALAGETSGFPGPAVEFAKLDGTGNPGIASLVDADGNRANTIDPD